jgi:hypothetical protein
MSHTSKLVLKILAVLVGLAALAVGGHFLIRAVVAMHGG